MWSPKKICSPCWELFNDMLHTTYTQVNHGDSWLLMVRSQIGTLTPNLSFGHNLCFKYSNGTCEPILDIYVLITFQWYKVILNPMIFDPCNCCLKIWESIGILTLEVGTHFGMCGLIPSHLPPLSGAWNVTPMLHFWPAPLQALALVASPKLGLQ
jgi:hypothetical protein